MSALAPRPRHMSFKFGEPGAKAEGVIVEPPEDRQARDYSTGNPKFWPDGNPIMQTKIVLKHDGGEVFAIYAEGRMAKAITSAIIEAGAGDLDLGGRLAVEFTHYGEGKNPANPPKEWKARYTPPKPRDPDDDGPDW